MAAFASIVVFACLIGGFSAENLQVCLKDLGCVQGTVLPGYQIPEFEAFMGIPYAQPPIGELRFKNPVAANAWTGILNATVPKDHCLQKNYFIKNFLIMGTEDCLYLNVYRPRESSDKLLPVLVYIHAGGFFSGSSHIGITGPDYFMDTEQVIMISMNYRLGPFGFLSTGDAHMPGNFGLKDQRLALQWVQRHISAFGGNPDLVTIAGHSAGGVSTHFHMLSPRSNGLFHRAMSFSGIALNSYAKIVVDPLAQARQLASQVGVGDAQSLDSAALTAALREVDGNELLNAGDHLKIWDNLPIVNYGAVVEPASLEDAFFTEDPVNTHLAGCINQVPWVLGMTSRSGEGALFLLRILDTPELLTQFNDDFVKYFSLTMPLPPTSTDIIQDLLQMYGLSSKLSKDTLRSLSELVGDFQFQYPIYVAAASYAGYADLQKNPISIYSFEYISEISFSVYFTDGTAYEVGTVHMDDALHFIRFSGLMPDFAKDSEDAMVIKRLTNMTVEFMKTGVFNPLANCSAADFTDNEICNYLKIEKTSAGYNEAVERRVDMRAMSIWKKFVL